MNGKNFARGFGMMMAVMMIVASQAAFAQRGHGKGDRGEQGQKLAAALNLTTDQQAKIKDLRQQFQQQHQTQIQEIENLHNQMRDLRKSGSSNKDQITQLRDQLKTKQEALATDRQKLQEQIRGVLTPEQAAKFDQMKSQFKGRGMHGKGRGADRGTTGANVQ
jgi:Spy/CpxP family protein refolding chaperone